jgi:hypothetical protein
MPNPYHDDKGQFSDAGGGVAVGKSFSPSSGKLDLPSLSFPVAPLGMCYDGSRDVGAALTAAGKKVKYAYSPDMEQGRGHMWVLVQDSKGGGWQAVDAYYGPVSGKEFYSPKYAFDDYQKVDALMPSYKETYEIDPQTHKPTGRKVIENKMNNSGENMPIQECQLEGKSGFSYGPEGMCYVHDGSDEGKKAARAKAEKQGQAIEISKHMDAGGEPTYEYLKKVWQLLMAHPGIWSQIKDEVHLQARGSAGGQRKAMKMGEFIKSENAAFIDGDYIETEEYIDAPTVFAKEGIFTGSNGKATLKRYETLKASLPRFLGAAATPKHINTDTLRPDDRWLGHAVNVTARDDKRDIFGYTRYYKSNLTTDELSKIREKQYPDGSIGFFTPIKSETGEFNGQQYEAEELGPYVITEYATMFDGTKGACTREQGCGPFQNSAVVDEFGIERVDVLRLIDGRIRKCPLKSLNQSGDIDTMDESELKKLLNETVKTAVKEGMGDLPERVAALEKEKNEAPKLAEDPTIKTLIATVGQLAESVKLVNAALPDIKAFKADQEAAKLATQKAAFAKHLNAAHQPTGKPDDEFEKVWNAASADPLGRDVWLANHPEVKVADVAQRDFAGKILNSGGAEFDMQAERAAHREKTGQVI